MNRFYLGKHNIALVVSFAAFLLWGNSSLILLDNPKQYDASLIVCIIFTIVFIIAAIIFYFKKIKLNTYIYASLALVCGIINIFAALLASSGVNIMASCINQALYAIVLLWFIQCFLNLNTTHGYILLSAILFCVFICLSFLGFFIIKSIYIVAPFICGICIFFFTHIQKVNSHINNNNSKSNKNNDTNSETVLKLSAHTAKAKLNTQQEKVHFFARFMTKQNVWLMIILIQLCALISHTFVNVLYNPFVINSQDFSAWQALYALIALCIIIAIYKIANKVPVSIYCFVMLIAIVFGITLFLVGIIGFISLPVTIIGTTNILLYIFTWILLIEYLSHNTYNAKTLLLFLISILTSSGILGRAFGFFILHSLDPSFNSLKALAIFFIILYILFIVIYIAINAYYQRQKLAKENEQEIAAVIQASAHNAEVSREQRIQKCCEDNGLTEREAQAITLLAQGMTRSAIAQKWVVSENTVKYHLRNAYKKLNIHNTRELNTLIDSIELH